MTFKGDPYRTLGLTPGASRNEIRLAYRRLAKQYHPDTAGERALPRFLAIRAAYDQLAGEERAPRPQGHATASRDAWRARRSGAAGTTGPGGGTSSRRATGGRPRPPGPGERHRARSGPRTATPGSTTYDEAAEMPLDPEWDGGSWYGTTSGTYWTINPREYADPRKHGPEYLARARRPASEGDEADDGPAAAGSDDPGHADESRDTGAAPEGT